MRTRVAAAAHATSPMQKRTKATSGPGSAVAAALATTAIAAKSAAARRSKADAGAIGRFDSRSGRPRTGVDSTRGDGDATIFGQTNVLYHDGRRFPARPVANGRRLRQMVFTMQKAKVSAIKVRPETILDDIERLCMLADMPQALARGSTTILKDNISWH